MKNEIDHYFEKPKKMFVYDWTTWDTLTEVDSLMESHHGWRAINWRTMGGTKERSSHSLQSAKKKSSRV